MKQISLFLLVSLFVLVAEIKPLNLCSVEGRAIDENGKSVAGAVIMIGLKDGDYGDVIEVSKADENGNFIHGVSCKPRKSEYLLVFPPIIFDHNYFVLIDENAASLVGNKKYKNLSGLKMRKQLANVGNVLIPSYRKIKINFKKPNGEPLFSDKNQWFEKRIRVRTFDNKFIKGSYFNDKFIINSSEIIMYMPDGKWKIEVVLDEDEKEILLADKNVEVIKKEKDEVQEFTLRMSKKNRN